MQIAILSGGGKTGSGPGGSLESDPIAAARGAVWGTRGPASQPGSNWTQALAESDDDFPPDQPSQAGYSVGLGLAAISPNVQSNTVQTFEAQATSIRASAVQTAAVPVASAPAASEQTRPGQGLGRATSAGPGLAVLGFAGPAASLQLPGPIPLAEVASGSQVPVLHQVIGQASPSEGLVSAMFPPAESGSAALIRSDYPSVDAAAAGLPDQLTGGILGAPSGSIPAADPPPPCSPQATTQQSPGSGDESDGLPGRARSLKILPDLAAAKTESPTTARRQTSAVNPTDVWRPSEATARTSLQADRPTHNGSGLPPAGQLRAAVGAELAAADVRLSAVPKRAFPVRTVETVPTAILARAKGAPTSLVVDQMRASSDFANARANRAEPATEAIAVGSKAAVTGPGEILTAPANGRLAEPDKFRVAVSDQFSRLLPVQSPVSSATAEPAPDTPASDFSASNRPVSNGLLTSRLSSDGPAYVTPAHVTPTPTRPASFGLATDWPKPDKPTPQMSAADSPSAEMPALDSPANVGLASSKVSSSQAGHLHPSGRSVAKASSVAGMGDAVGPAETRQSGEGWGQTCPPDHPRFARAVEPGPTRGETRDGTPAYELQTLGAQILTLGEVSEAGRNLTVAEVRPTDEGRDAGGPLSIERQIVQLLGNTRDNPVEMTLAPEELGHVKVTLHTQGQGILLTVVAERPETLDLMRRHIDGLSQELRAIGYSNVSFEFGNSPGHRHSGAPPPHAERQPHSRPDWQKPEPPPPSIVELIRQSTTGGAGLDLRL